MIALLRRAATRPRALLPRARTLATGAPASPNVIEATPATFTQLIKDNSPVIIDFYANWCGPCRMLTPILSKSVDAHGGRIKLVKVNVDECEEAAAEFNIMSLPTVMALKDGKKLDSFMGVRNAAFVDSFVEAALRKGVS